MNKATSTNRPRKPMEWAQEAPHIGALLSMTLTPLTTLLAVVAETRDRLIQHLESVEPPFPVVPLNLRHDVVFMHPPGHPDRGDLRDPDVGVQYCLKLKNSHTGRNLAAVTLLLRCLHILERGNLTGQDRAMFCAEYLAMAGVDAESKSIAAKKPRGPRPQKLLRQRLEVVHRECPGETLDELLTRLVGDGLVVDFDVDGAQSPCVRWVDGGKQIHTSRGTVKGWLTELNKMR